MIEHLSKKSELAYAYLSVLFQRNDQSFIQQKFWPYLIRTSTFPDSTRALAFFYKTLKHKEHYLYLYHAMALIIYEDRIGKIDEYTNNNNDDEIDAEKLYEDHLKNESTMELDSFVFDRHTGATTSRSDFALEGARVSNECQELFIDKYRQMYNDFKILIDQDEEQSKQKTSKKRKMNEKQTDSTNKKSKVELDEEIIRLGYQLDIQDQAFLTDQLANLPHGQRRTSAHKKAVFISTDYVYKGPYRGNSPGDVKKFLNNLYFTRALIALEEDLKLSEDLRSIVDWHSVIKISDVDEYYLKQKALGNLSTDENDRELVTTKVEKNVQVLRRGSHIHRLVELENDQDNFPEIYRATIQHFYLRYLLNVGDSGTWNILVRRDEDQRICGIDFEELRSEKVKKATDSLTMIMSKVSKRQRQLYQSYTNQIEIFRNPIELTSQLAQTLSISLKIDVEKMNKRIENYAKSLEQKK